MLDLNQALLVALVVGGLGGFVRSIFHYAKKVMSGDDIKFDIGKLAWSVGRAVAGAALVGAAKADASLWAIFMAGLSADVLGKDFWNYILAYFKDK